MATRKGFSLVGRSLGTAVVITAAQLGIVQGLIVLDWRATAAEDIAWKAAQTWLVFVFAVGVLGGVATVRRMLPPVKGRVAARLGVSICAALGAALSLPLVWLPLRAAGSTADFSPEVGGTVAAGVGVILGLTLAVAGLTAVPIARGVAATVVWVWSFALASAAWGSLVVTESGPPRLGVLDGPRFAGSGQWWLGVNLMIVIAVLLGLTLAAIARKARAGRLATALSGVAGPALVAAAYLAAGPATGEDTTHIQAYVASLTAAVGGTSRVHRGGARASGGATSARRRWSTPPSSPKPRRRPSAPRSFRRRGPRGPARRPRSRALACRRCAAAGEGRKDGEGWQSRQRLASPRRWRQQSHPLRRSRGRPSQRCRPSQTAGAVAPKQRPSLAKIIAPDRPARPVPVSPAPAGAAAPPEAAEGSGRSDQPERLRRREREHIDWIKNLVNLPEDPLLKARKKAKR